MIGDVRRIRSLCQLTSSTNQNFYKFKSKNCIIIRSHDGDLIIDAFPEHVAVLFRIY